MIEITRHDRTEWTRLAKDAYANGCAERGHQFSAAAAVLPDRITCAVYDRLQGVYRLWLINGLDAIRA